MIAGGVDVEQCLIYILGSGKLDFSNINPAQGGRNFVPMEGMEYKENTGGGSPQGLEIRVPLGCRKKISLMSNGCRCCAPLSVREQARRVGDRA